MDFLYGRWFDYHGEKHIYSDDLLMVKAVSGEITDSPGEVSLSLMFTQ